MPRTFLITVSLTTTMLSATPVAGNDAAALDYSRDVRPILSQHCFHCHGPDEATREADLRLDVSEEAYADRGDYVAIKPGRIDLSEAYRRISSTDPNERMPPPQANRELSPQQIETLRRWIEQGAEYRQHWALIPPQQQATPEVKLQAWPRNPIDQFVLAKLEAAGLQPSAEADKYQLVRRVYLDLIGLPPTPAEADKFVLDHRADAYELLVDRLLASPRYGERWARRWLDLARYSDTNGYEKDRTRDMWLYRDWVINALNADMPFDQFTVEQLAGDMLPEATIDQRIATGFHRNTMTNEEGGVDPQEFRYQSIVDRVATTGTTWLGLTVGCAQCHTHKYDPITHTDYFGLFAFFNNADELKVPVHTDDARAKRESIEAQIAEIQRDLPKRFPVPEDYQVALQGSEAPATDRREGYLQQRIDAWVDEQARSLAAWNVLTPASIDAGIATATINGDGSILLSGDVTKNDVYTLRLGPDDAAGPITAIQLEALPDESLPLNGPGRQTIGDTAAEGVGDFYLSALRVYIADKAAAKSAAALRPIPLAAASETFASPNKAAANAIDDRSDTGWSITGRSGERHVAVFQLAEPLTLKAGEQLVVRLEHESYYPGAIGRLRIAATADARSLPASALPAAVAAAVLTATADRTPAQRQELRNHFLSVAPELQAEHARIQSLRQSMPAYPTALVMQERPGNPRNTHRRHRGEYLQPREAVTPRVPEILPLLPAGATADRLMLARWLVDPQHPLTARVAMNRQWEAFFGQGLVSTLGDFGVQGQYPTHPELLDWLATEFVDRGWSLKQMHRLIVTSAAYRQASRVTEPLQQRDPENQLLARGPRFRVDAELVRDSLLHASGLLSPTIGGPSVFADQPPGITEGTYVPMAWKRSEGADRFRRGLYTFNKRVAPYAAFGLFDAPTGEACVARRTRSTTPLQSLELLNDEVTLEAARSLARQVLAPGDRSAETVADHLFRQCLTRPPATVERDAILRFVSNQRDQLQSDPDAVKAIAGEPSASEPVPTPPVELAAWTLAARSILNADEMITRP